MEANDLQPTPISSHQNELIGWISNTGERYGLMEKYVLGLQSNNLSIHRACAKLMANLTHWDCDCDAFVAQGGLDALFGTPTAIMEGGRRVCDFHMVIIANFCRCKSPDMLNALKAESVRFVAHIAKALKLAILPSFSYVLDILAFFQGFTLGANAIKADPELMGALGSVHRFWVYDLCMHDNFAFSLTIRFPDLLKNTLRQYERWVPYTDIAVPALIRRCGIFTEMNDERGREARDLCLMNLGTWSHVKRLSWATHRAMWEAGAPLFADLIIESVAHRVSLEVQGGVATCLANLLSVRHDGDRLSVDDIRPVKSKLMKALVATISRPVNNASQQVQQMMLGAFVNLGHKGRKCCVWILRDCMVALLGLIARQKARLADARLLWTCADPILDRTIDLVYVVFNTLVEHDSEDSTPGAFDASFALKPDDCGKLRSSGIDAIADEILSGVPPDPNLGPAGQTRCLRLVKALDKCNRLFVSLETDERGGCAVCGVTENLKACSMCKVVQYCSREHQKEAWKSHKVVCTQMKNRKQLRRERLRSHETGILSSLSPAATVCTTCKTPEDRERCPHHCGRDYSEVALSDEPTPLPSEHTAISLRNRRVRLCGLTRAEMNGIEGIVLQVVTNDPGRCLVLLDGSGGTGKSKVKVKAENLEPLE